MRKMDAKADKTLSFYDTFSRRRVPLVPLDPKNVRLYVCGPTVYDYAHIGNARPVVVFDVLYRLLKHLFPKVTYVRNITDVDDKINERAITSGRSIQEITDETTRIFHSDMDALGALAPDIEPRATEHIPQMVEMIECLIEKGHAYENQGHVLFNVPSMPDYGSAMSKMYLGETFDIHAGGIDLVFPHHENEIAQSRCAFGTCKMANMWMHNGYVTVEGEKMSKSLGNFYTVNDLLKDWPGETIRYALLSGHYRAPLNYSIKGLSDAQGALDRLYQSLRLSEDIEQQTAFPGEAVLEALADDLNTPVALSKLHALARRLNKTSDNEEKKKVRSEMIGSAKLLGLLNEKPDNWFQKGSKQVSSPTDAEIEKLIQAREQARENRDFGTADEIRDQLKSMGVILEDSKSGTTWKTS